MGGMSIEEYEQLDPEELNKIMEQEDSAMQNS